MRRFAKVKNASDDIQLPARSTKYSAGYDFILPEDVLIQPHECSNLVLSGIKAYMEPDEYLGITIRSSLAKKLNIRIPQGEAIIDADYVDNPTNEGNIGLMFFNDSNNPVLLIKGTKVAQGIFKKYYITDDDCVTEERLGGFGSTGDKQ